MMVSTHSKLNIFLVLSLFCTTIKAVDVDNQKKYCGGKLEEVMSAYCLIYNSPNDRRKRSIARECCHQPCSLNYLLTHYCKEIDQIKLEKDRTNATTSAPPELQNDGPIIFEDIEVVLPKKKKKRKTRPKRNCTCKKPLKKLDSNLVEILKNRRVPQSKLGHIEESAGAPFYILYKSRQNYL